MKRYIKHLLVIILVFVSPQSFIHIENHIFITNITVLYKPLNWLES